MALKRSLILGFIPSTAFASNTMDHSPGYTLWNINELVECILDNSTLATIRNVRLVDKRSDSIVGTYTKAQVSGKGGGDKGRKERRKEGDKQPY